MSQSNILDNYGDFCNRFGIIDANGDTIRHIKDTVILTLASGTEVCLLSQDSIDVSPQSNSAKFMHSSHYGGIVDWVIGKRCPSELISDFFRTVLGFQMGFYLLKDPDANHPWLELEIQVTGIGYRTLKEPLIAGKYHIREVAGELE